MDIFLGLSCLKVAADDFEESSFVSVLLLTSEIFSGFDSFSFGVLMLSLETFSASLSFIFSVDSVFEMAGEGSIDGT